MKDSENRKVYPFTHAAACGYRAYAASTGNKNFRGEPMPEFEALPIPIKTAWEAAVRHVLAVNEGEEGDEQAWAGWRRPQDMYDEAVGYQSEGGGT